MDWKRKVKRILGLGVVITCLAWTGKVVALDLNQSIEQQIDTVNNKSKIEYRIWSTPVLLNSRQIANDSLLRWTPTRTVNGWLKQYPGFRVYSLGTSERQAALYRLTADPRHLELTLDGVDLKNPLTGHVDLDRISLRQLQDLTESMGGGSQLFASFREHYLNEPRLYLYFDENGTNIRNLDVLYTHNIKKNINVELGYHDRRDGLSFYGMNLTSGILHSRIYWQKTPSFRLKAGLNSRVRESEESFGYTDSELFTFSFNPLIIRPKLSEKSRTAMLDGFLRAEWDLQEKKNRLRSEVSDPRNTSFLSIGLNAQTYNRVLHVQFDSSEAGFDRLELHADYVRKIGRWSGHASLRNRVEMPQGNSFRGMTTSGVSFNETTIRSVLLETDVRFQILGQWYLYAQVLAGTRSDDRNRSSLIGGLYWQNPKGDQGDLYMGRARYLPDWQSLYWSSNLITGNRLLMSEEAHFSGIRLRKGVFDWLETEAAIEMRDTHHTPFTNSTGQFDTSDRIRMLAASFSVRFDQPRYDVTLHATMKSAIDSGDDEYSRWIDAMGTQRLIQGSFFIKGPIYNQAAYTRAGIIARWVPMNERAPKYQPLLDRWQFGLDSRVIPSYVVADMHISTRLRWMMVYLQLENVFHGLGQMGYFETPGYPISGRRFIFGIQVLFKN